MEGYGKSRHYSTLYAQLKFHRGIVRDSGYQSWALKAGKAIDDLADLLRQFVELTLPQLSVEADNAPEFS